MSELDRETALEPDGDGRWRATVSDRWNIGDNPNGGYLVAIVLGAMRTLSAHPDPVSVTSHFLRPGVGGAPAVVTAEVLRAGRTLTTLRAELSQGGSTRVAVVAAFSDLDAATGATGSLTIDPPSLPSPDRCPRRSGDEQGVALPILDVLDIRIHPDQAEAGRAGRPEVSGWIRLRDGSPPDARALVLFADAFPPSLFGSLGPVGWVPTVELTVQVRRRPASGWVLGRSTTDDLDRGRMVEDGALWDSTGALVARSRQLGLLLPR